MRTKNNRVREGNGRRFQGRRKGKEKSFCFVVVQFELIIRHNTGQCGNSSGLQDNVGTAAVYRTMWEQQQFIGQCGNSL